MANTTSQVKTWSSFYDSNKEETPTLQAAYKMLFETYNTMIQALNKLGDELVLRMATLPHNFVLLPARIIRPGKDTPPTPLLHRV